MGTALFGFTAKNKEVCSAVGFGGSVTITLKDLVPVFPALSVALQIIFVVPTARVEPD